MDDFGELRHEAQTTPVHEIWAKGGPVFSHLSDEVIHGLEGRTMATFGDAGTVGMWAFASGACLTGLFQANLLPEHQLALLFPALIAYSGVVLITAAFFLFRRNNSFLGSTFCSFGGFNLTRGLLLLCESRGWLPSGATANCVQGIMFEIFTYVALSLLVGAIRVNMVLILILASVAIGFCLTGIPLITNGMGQNPWEFIGHVGGYFMLAASGFAYYGGSAMVVNTAWQRNVLPLGGEA
jgi:succinate-acetate transporter protein